MPPPLDNFYTSLAATCDSALPLAKSLALSGRADLASLADGRPLADILAAGGFPSIDVAVVRAAEASGGVEPALRSLARKAREATILRRRINAVVIYPMFVVHGAVIIPWILQWFIGKPSVWALLGDIAAIWVVFLILRALLRSRLAESLPVAGPICHKIALARFCDALSGALDAALPMRRAFDLAADAAGGATGERAKAVVELNCPLVESLATVLPPLSLEMLRAGEEAGSIDKVLTKLGHQHFEDAIHSLNKLVALLPVILFLVVAALAVLQMMSIGLPTSLRGGQ